MLLNALVVLGCMDANFCIPIIIAPVTNRSISSRDIISRDSFMFDVCSKCVSSHWHLFLQKGLAISGIHQKNSITKTGNITHNKKYLKLSVAQKLLLKIALQ